MEQRIFLATETVKMDNPDNKCWLIVISGGKEVYRKCWDKPPEPEISDYVGKMV